MCLSVLVLPCVVQGCLEKAGTVAVGNIFTHSFFFVLFFYQQLSLVCCIPLFSLHNRKRGLNSCLILVVSSIHHYSGTCFAIVFQKRDSQFTHKLTPSNMISTTCKNVAAKL